MSGHDDHKCEFGHTFAVYDHDKKMTENTDVTEGKIKDLDDMASDDLTQIMGDAFKHVKVSAGSQGTPMAAVFTAPDKFDEDWDWNVKKTHEQLHIAPESNLHQEFMQRKSQAEQNVRETMRNLSQLKKTKHMLEHDIRKLRSRAEALEDGNETQIKGDFVELVDGAGGGQQGSDEASLKFLRDQNIYPSVVADFNEMESIDDLKDGNKLGHLPENEKAVLKKKYTMYEKWKDLYGSEIHRKLRELKSSLKSIETSVRETQDWLAPYVKDLVMINDASKEDIAAHLGDYFSFRGYSTMFRDAEFVCYQPCANHHGSLSEVDSEEDATHYKVILLKGIHVNLSGFEQPQSPAEGPGSGIIQFFPAIVCKHVFENFFKKKINRKANKFDKLMSEYTGDFETGEGIELRDKRKQHKLSVRELREAVNEEIEGEASIELSSVIRRVEDGLDKPEAIEERFGPEVLEAIDSVLDTSFSADDDSGDDGPGEFQATVKKFIGDYNHMYMSKGAQKGELTNLTHEMTYKYYFDFKIGLGLNTMS